MMQSETKTSNEPLTFAISEKEVHEEIKCRRDEWEREQDELRPTLTEDDIAFIVGRWTGDPCNTPKGSRDGTTVAHGG